MDCKANTHTQTTSSYLLSASDPCFFGPLPKAGDLHEFGSMVLSCHLQVAVEYCRLPSAYQECRGAAVLAAGWHACGLLLAQYFSKLLGTRTHLSPWLYKSFEEVIWLETVL